MKYSQLLVDNRLRFDIFSFTLRAKMFSLKYKFCNSEIWHREAIRKWSAVGQPDNVLQRARKAKMKKTRLLFRKALVKLLVFNFMLDTIIE